MPAVDTERTFWRGCTSWFRVGSVSICIDVRTGEHCRYETYHFDRSICQIDERGRNLPIMPGCIECFGIPKGEHCTDQLSKALGPHPVRIGLPTCAMSINVFSHASVSTDSCPDHLVSGNILGKSAQSIIHSWSILYPLDIIYSHDSRGSWVHVSTWSKPSSSISRT